MLAPPAVGTCVAGVCGVSCPFGLVQCGSTCVLIDADQQNCGTCGYVCATGEVCNAGACMTEASLVLATTTVPVGSDAGDVIVDGTNVIYIDVGDSSVHLVPLAGGPSVTLATNQAVPVRLAADGTYVYWSSNLGGAIVRTREDGTGTFEVVASASQPYALAVDATYVYWIDTGTSSFLRAPKTATDGGAPVSFGTIPFSVTWPATNIVAGNGVLYIGNSPATYAFTTPSGPLTSLPTGGTMSNGLAVGGSTLYGKSAYTAGWFDLTDLSFNGTETIPAESVADGMTANACAAFLPTDFMPNGIAVLPHSAHTPFLPVIVLATLSQGVNRMVLADGYLVYSFEGGAPSAGGVAKIAIPPP
jgi:hypothetical protein